MKKIFYFIASAIVALGAMACQNEVDENITPENTNEISFTVSFDESTRVMGTVKDKTATFELDGSESLAIGDVELSYDEVKKVFVATSDDDKATLNGLIGETVTATVDDANNSLKFASDGFVLAQENNITVSLACPALYFTVPADTEVALTVNEVTKNYTAGSYFVGIEGDTADILYLIGGKYMKDTTLTDLDNKVYNLGELSKIIYLAPGEWDQADAWFSAHFFNAKDGFADVKMTDKDADGIYECNVPVGMESVIFCRMNPTYDEFSWEDGHVWNQTGNLTIAEGDTYQMVGWSWGEWASLYTKKVYVKLNDNWSSTPTKRIAAYFFIKNTNTSKWVAMTEMGDNIYGIEVPTDQAYDQVIFCRMNTENNTLDWSAKWDQTKDLDIPTGNNRLYTIVDGAWSSGNGSWSNMLQ